MRICPLESTWKKIYRKLESYSKSRKLPKPPEPLIVGAWEHSSVVEKMVRWSDTVMWASSFGYSGTTGKIPKESFFFATITSSELMRFLIRHGTAEQVFNAGIRLKRLFDSIDGLNALITKDKTGQWIYKAGANWQDFDYKKGWKALIRKDKSGESIVSAGFDWRLFDPAEALKELAKRDKTGQLIAEAGSLWAKFDHRKRVANPTCCGTAG